jgi:hypothetical protein
MALIPRTLRPSVMIRRKAMHNGFLGPSTLWKVIGVFVFGRSTLKRFFGKNVEVIDVSRLSAGRFMQMTTTKPLSRRARKKMKRAGQTPPTLKGERARGRQWADSQSRAS